MPPTRKHGQVVVVVFIIALVAVIVLLAASSGAGLLFVLAVAPSAFLLWHFYHADKYKHESKRLLGGTFLIGAASVIPAVILESVFTQPSPDTPFLALFAYFLFGVGLVEEFMKFLSVRVYPYRSEHFDEPMDGIVFGVAAALGFATVENILYVFENGVWSAVVRAVVSVPGHAFWGAIIGFYLGEAKIRRRPLLALVGLGIAVLLHGVFDTLSFVVSNEIVSLFLLLCLVGAVYLKVVKKEIAEAEAESPYRDQTQHLAWTNTPPTTARGTLRFCPQCGVPVEAGAKFCVNCGQRIA